MLNINEDFGYANIRVRRSHEAMTDAEIAHFAPSVFMDNPHPERSEEYGFMPTYSVLAGLRHEGFEVFEVREAHTRDENKEGYQRHMLRLRHPTGKRVLNEVFPEIVLINSHDGSSSFRLANGMFRLVCLNGMTMPMRGGNGYDIRVRHDTNVLDNVIDAAYTVIEDVDRLTNHVPVMKALPLKRSEAEIFAEQAAVIRWGSEDLPPPVTVDQLLQVRRADDMNPDLWSTFNVIQENIIKGGLHGQRVDKNLRNRNVTTRPVEGIDANTRINQGLWSLAELIASMKGVEFA